MIDSKTIGWYSTKNNNQPKGTDYWTPENQTAYFPGRVLPVLRE